MTVIMCLIGGEPEEKDSEEVRLKDKSGKKYSQIEKEIILEIYATGLKTIRTKELYGEFNKLKEIDLDTDFYENLGYTMEDVVLFVTEMEAKYDIEMDFDYVTDSLKSVRQLANQVTMLIEKKKHC